MHNIKEAIYENKSKLEGIKDQIQVRNVFILSVLNLLKFVLASFLRQQLRPQTSNKLQ